MDNPYKRKKDPERVKQLILEAAMHQLAEQGLAGFSLQSVADAAGVTKGGLLHHFPNKQVLMQSAVAEVISLLDQAIEQHIEKDPVAYGCFTRAYIHFTLQKDTHGIGSLSTAVSMAMLTDQAFNQCWIAWMEGRLARHVQTDASMDLMLLRYAADGLWLTMYTGVDEHSTTQLLVDELLRRTYPAS
jgi:AcrR family transcriptional regulator